MLDKNKFEQYGFPREKKDIQGITIHETGNYEMNAQQLHDFLNNENKTSQGVHYIVDKDSIIQVMPDDWAVYHTGKGKDWGCRYTLAIEIVSYYSDEDYKTAEDRAISLIYDLQKKYRIDYDMIFFHQDFNERVFCPNRALLEYKSSKSFVYQRIER